MTYSELVKSNADETDIRSFLTGGSRYPSLFAFPKTFATAPRRRRSSRA